MKKTLITFLILTTSIGFSQDSEWTYLFDGETLNGWHEYNGGAVGDSWSVKNGELILINSHISAYKQASYSNHNPTDERKLLLNKKEINKLIGKMQRDGFTIVPTKMYFKKGKAKIELAIAKGKKQFDKRATKKNRDWNRDKARYIRKSS